MTGMQFGARGRRRRSTTVRADVAKLHGELVRYGLVVWTGGQRLGAGPRADLFVIKPSGVSYDDLAPENMILCDLDGNAVPGAPGSERSPSSDTAAHAYVYRHMPDVGGVVHTHSTFAVAWAARGEEIPCVITAMADEFGGPIPVGPVRDHRRRLDRPRHRRDAQRTTAHAPCSCRTTDRSRSACRPRMRSRPRSWSRTSPGRCISRARPAR